MNGTITPTQPLTALSWQLASFYFNAKTNAMLASVEIFANEEARIAGGEPLSKRDYDIPLTNTGIIPQAEALMYQVLKTAVEKDGLFTLQNNL